MSKIDEIMLTKKVKLINDYESLTKDSIGIVLYPSNNGVAILTNNSFCENVPFEILSPH